jgi:hypothetical protein
MKHGSLGLARPKGSPPVGVRRNLLELVEGKAVNSPKTPTQRSDGLSHTLLPDGRVKFILTRQGRAVGHVLLPPSQASEVAANALGAAVDAYDRTGVGGAPPTTGEPRDSTAPFVRITGLAVANCPIEDHVCLVIKAGAAEIGFALPRKRLTEFAQWVVQNETVIAEQLK